MAKRDESAVQESVAAPEATLSAGTDTCAPADPSGFDAAGTARVLPDPTVDLDSIDERAGGSWEDVEERTLRVHYPKGSGVYLRLGPGRSFDSVQTLPNGTVVRALPVPEWARVPGWLCVEAEMFHGTAVHGWVDETLVEADED